MSGKRPADKRIQFSLVSYVCPVSTTLKLLAFDTSTEWCSAAVLADGAVHSQAVWAGQKHSELLLPMVQEVLAEAGLALAQLDAIAVGQGPGSFTGLRIACGAAQGLAFGSGLPVIQVITLEAMAAHALKAIAVGGVVACIDARMNEVYAAIYEKSAAGLRAVSTPGLYAPAQAPLPSDDMSYIGCGSGFKGYADILAERYAGQLVRIEPDVHPHAEAIAALAVTKWQAGDYVAAEAVEPLYIRDKVALKTCER